MNNQRNLNVLRLTNLAMLTSISLVLLMLIHFPIFPATKFLEYDMADVPILLGTLAFGPAYGLILLIISSFFQWILISPEGMWVGFVMHVAASGMLVLSVGFARKILKNKASVIIGMVIGCILMTSLMIVLNLTLTVKFYHVPSQMVKDWMIPFIIPFNLIKSSVNCMITFFVFIPYEKLIKYYNGKM